MSGVRPVGERSDTHDATRHVTVRGPDWFFLYPMLCPLVLLVAGNDAFGFDPPGWLDSYIYLGYFWHYPDHLWLFDDNSNYKISRLPWLLPGFAAHSLLSPVAAARVLAYCALTSAAVALYLHVRDAIHDRYAAAFTSVLLACCTGMHAPGGWYYQALPAAGFYLWCCWFLTRAASARSTVIAWGAAAGACYAAAVHTHVFLAVFAPLLALLLWGALGAADQRRWTRWRIVTASAIGGGLCLTALLAAINRLTGGEWLFFLPQLQLAADLSQHDRWWLPAGQWLPGATYLVLPIALMVTALSAVIGSANLEQRLKGTLIALPCLALAVTCVFQFWTQETTLDYDYMAFVLYLHALPASALAVWSPPTANRRPAVLLAIATAVILAALLFLMPATLPAVMAAAVERLGLAHLPRLVPPLLFSLAGVAIARAIPRPLRLIAVAVWFSIVNAWVAPQPQAYGVGTAGSRQEMLETFREADTVTHDLDPTLIGIKYWMSTEELQTPHGSLQSQYVFDSFLATRAWLTNLFARTSPGLPIQMLTREHLASASCLGILSSTAEQQSLARQMMAHYASLDEPLAVVAEHRFQRQEFGFALTVLRPVNRMKDPSTYSRPCTRDAVDRR
jgi:hypothetical protein